MHSTTRTHTHARKLTYTLCPRRLDSSKTWLALKPRVHELVSTILYPLMCFTDEDQELWDEDPQEFVRLKYDVLEEFNSPHQFAGVLLLDFVKKRVCVRCCGVGRLWRHPCGLGTARRIDHDEGRRSVENRAVQGGDAQLVRGELHMIRPIRVILSLPIVRDADSLYLGLL